MAKKDVFEFHLVSLSLDKPKGTVYEMFAFGAENGAVPAPRCTCDADPNCPPVLVPICPPDCPCDQKCSCEDGQCSCEDGLCSCEGGMCSCEGNEPSSRMDEPHSNIERTANTFFVLA